MMDQNGNCGDRGVGGTSRKWQSYVVCLSSLLAGVGFWYMRVLVVASFHFVPHHITSEL